MRFLLITLTPRLLRARRRHTLLAELLEGDVS